jgi:vancomycin resistance protein YoaR
MGFGAPWGTSRIPPAVEFDPAAARERIEGIAANLDRRPVEGAVEVYGGEVEVGEAQRGYKTDVGRTLENVDLAVKDLRGEARVVGAVLEPEVSTEAARVAGEKAEKALSGPVTLTAEGQRWVLPVEAIEQSLVVAPQGDRIEVSLDEGAMRANLDVVYSALTVEPVEASYDVDGNEVSVVPGRSGREVREDQLMARLNDGIFGGGRRGVDVPVFTADPNLTTAEAERQRPNELLANYRTNYLTYDDSEGRITNLRLASQAVNGTLVAPGEVFSFNALAAPLEYEESKVIIKGRVDTAEGGGLCQVSSTLYMAANLAGLDVIERHPHYAELPYIRPGFDATVWFGRDSGSPLDMKFQNDSPGYLLLTEWIDSDGYVNASIFGRESGKEVEMSSRKVSTRKDGDGDPVNKWVTRQKITQNGEVIFNDVLHTDVYKTLKKNEATTDERPPN